MPGRNPRAGVRIFEGLVLQPPCVKSECPTQLEEPFFVGADEVNHRLTVDLMAMKPNAAVQGESHPLTAALEFTIGLVYVQVILPSTVAGATGVAFPENNTHSRVVCPWVARADHPPGDACRTVSVTPVDERKLFRDVKLVV